MAMRSGNLIVEPAEGEAAQRVVVQGSDGCSGACRNHAIDGGGAGNVAGKRNSGMDEQIGVADRGVILARVNPAGAAMMRVHARRAQGRTDFPDIGTDNEIRSQAATGLRRQGAGYAAVL